MKKLSRILIFVILVISYLTSSFAFAADPEQKWIGGLGSIPINGLHPHQQGLEKFAELLAERTNGRLVVETIYHSGQVGNERDLFESVSMGTVHVSFITTPPVTGFLPDFAVLDLPYIFKSREHAHRVLDSDIGKELLAQMDAHNVVGLSFGENGLRHMTNSRGPIVTPTDMTNMKIRSMESPIHIATFKAMGANPTPMVWGEVFTGLQQKTIDGQENMIMGILTAKLYEVNKYLSLTEHFYTPAVFIINKDVFDALSPEDQQIIREIGQEAAVYQREEGFRQNQWAMDELKKFGVEVNDVDKNAFMECVKPVYDQFPEYSKLIERIQKIN